MICGLLGEMSSMVDLYGDTKGINGLNCLNYQKVSGPTTQCLKFGEIKVMMFGLLEQVE